MRSLFITQDKIHVFADKNGYHNQNIFFYKTKSLNHL